METKKKKSTDKLSFEQALKELEEIAQKLESGNLDLDDSIAGFERGIELKKFCTKKLEEAEMKIEILQKAGSGADEKKVTRKKIKIKPESCEVDDDEDLQGSLL